MPEEKTYKVDKETYVIPELEVGNFLKDNPTAVEVNSFKVGKDTLDIPVNETESFLKDMPGAQPLKKKSTDTSLPSPSILPLASANGASGVVPGASVPSGIDYLQGTNQIDLPQPVPVTDTAPQPLITDPGFQQPVTPVSQMPQAVTSPVTSIAKDQKLYSPKIQKEGLSAPELAESVMRGIARLGSSTLKSPALLYDIASTITNEVINDPLGIPRAPSSEEIANKLPADNPTAGLDKAIQNSAEIHQQKYDKEINEYFHGENKDIKKGLMAVANAVLESAPTTIALALGNAMGVSGAQLVMALGLVFGADKMSEIEKAHPNISQEQKIAIAAANGLFEGAFEQFGITKLGGMLKDVIAKSGEGAAKKMAEKSFKEVYAPILKRYLGVGAEEVSSEVATQFSQNVVDKYGGLNPDLDLRTGLKDAAIVALGMAGPSATGVAALDLMVTSKNRKKAIALADKKKILEDDLVSPDVSDAAKPVISEKIKDINAEEADLAADEKKKIDELPDESKKEIHDLQEQAKKIADAAVDETISDETREILKKDLDDVDKQIDKVFEEAPAKKEAEAAKEQAESQAVQDEIDFLTEVKNSIGLEPEEEAHLKELENKEIDDIQDKIDDINEARKTRLITLGEHEQLTELENQKEEITNQKPKTNAKKTSEGHQAQETDVVLTTEPAAQATIPEPDVAEILADIEANPVKEDVKKPKETGIADEEEVDTKDSPEALTALDKDIEAMKQMSTSDLAEKKFVGMVERAWKAKEEGKISKPTYTEFRNKAKDILEGKVKAKDNVDATEAKLRSTAALNKVKNRLIGQDYKKLGALTGPPITPQMVSDMIDLTNRLIHRGIDAGFTLAEATKKALDAVRKHPTYKKLVAAKAINDKDFEKSLKPEKEPKTKEVKEPGSTDIEGETRKKKTVARQETTFKEVVAEMTENEKFYTSIKQNAVEPHISKILDEVQSSGGLEQMAEAMLKGENPFHEKIAQVAAALTAERLNILAEKEGNEMQKNALRKLAAKLFVARNKVINVSATQTALEAIIAQRLPLSEEGLKAYATEAMSGVQDTYFSEQQKKDVAQATKDINEILESEEGQKAIREAVEAEIDRIAEATNGKDWVSNVNEAIESLKIDLTDC